MDQALTNITPAQLASIPAGPPPPGVIPNFVNPPSDGYILIVVGSLLMTVMFLLATLRFYTKIFVVKNTTWDDWTTLTAIIGTVLYFIVCVFAVTRGKIGTHSWDISLAFLLSNDFQVPSFLINFFSAVVWPFAKLSFFIFYLKLFRPNIWLRYAIYFGAFVNCAFYFAVVVFTLCFTAPAPGQTFADAFLSPRYGRMFNTTIPIASGSLVLDLYIFCLPVAGVWNLQLSTRRKLGILAIFLTGLAACVASSLSIYYKYLLDEHTTDFTYYTFPVITMALVEMCVGVSASCMPSLAQLARQKPVDWSTFRSALFHPFKSLRGSSLKNDSSSDDSHAPYAGNGPYVNLDQTEVLKGGFEMHSVNPV